MRPGIFHIIPCAVAALVLAACGFADSRAPVPGFMRAQEAEPPPPEPPPDIKQLVRTHLDSVFIATSAPHDVRVSPARHDLHGLGWTACVKAELNSATGKPLGPQIYRVSIENGVILDRRHVEADDTCVNETYEPI